ncbi:RcpC/CpaB family pilus assembly protein, partial [Streptomyces sp. B1866]|uniref:RcpC/CpaB family pilus assembly protein n=1 Tax=Streptomyces sp. B1866 TaxID=3075431 RepID=UPI00288E7388
AAAAPRGDGRAGQVAVPAADDPRPDQHEGTRHGGRVDARPGPARPDLVSAPVRIADAAAVRLLRPGDRVDVVATSGFSTAREPAPARVVARGARVAEVPEPRGGEDGAGGGATAAEPGGGALVVLAVPRATAAALAGAGATSRLAVTLC